MSTPVARILGAIMLCATLTSCGVPPGFRIRDDYMGRKLVDRVTGRDRVLDHDGMGNTILYPNPRQLPKP